MIGAPIQSAGTVAVVLAAGGGSRFGGPTHKLDALLDRGLGERTVLQHAIDAAAESSIGPIIVVTASHVRTPIPDGVDRIVNPDWHTGQMSSLRLGLDAAADRGADRVVVGLGDQPFVSPDAWRSVAGTDAPIAVATYDGRRGHPVLLRNDVWSMLAGDGDAGDQDPNRDQGARPLMHLRPDLVVEVPCQGSPIDIDTLEDLHRWQNNSSTSSP